MKFNRCATPWKTNATRFRAMEVKKAICEHALAQRCYADQNSCGFSSNKAARCVMSGNRCWRFSVSEDGVGMLEALVAEQPYVPTWVGVS